MYETSLKTLRKVYGISTLAPPHLVRSEFGVQIRYA